MYIRKKTAKGRTYYQVVRGVREGCRVRQEIVVSLGTNPDVESALKAERGYLRRLRCRRRYYRDPVDLSRYSKTIVAEAARLDRRITATEEKIAVLTSIRKSIGPTQSQLPFHL